jgi:hypothetical protein
MSAARIPLSLLPGLLRDRELVQRPVGYREIYRAAVDARIPAVRGANGRWSVADRDLSQIAETLCNAIAA